MKKKDRVNRFIEYFSKNLPEAKTELEYNNAFELTVAVVLSAQCTDKRVNIITKNLFKKMPTAEIMASSSVDEIFTLIKSCSYPRNKAKHLFGLSNMLINDFNAKIPNNSKDLQMLPGVGRKTANVVASVYFDIPSIGNGEGMRERTKEKAIILTIINVLLFTPPLVFWIIGNIAFIYYSLIIMSLVIILSCSTVTTKYVKKNKVKSAYTQIN